MLDIPPSTLPMRGSTKSSTSPSFGALLAKAHRAEAAKRRRTFMLAQQVSENCWDIDDDDGAGELVGFGGPSTEEAASPPANLSPLVFLRRVFGAEVQDLQSRRQGHSHSALETGADKAEGIAEGCGSSHDYIAESTERTLHYEYIVEQGCRSRRLPRNWRMVGAPSWGN